MGYDLRISSRLYDVTFDNEGSLLQGYLERSWRKSLHTGEDYHISKKQVGELVTFMKDENSKSKEVEGRNVFSTIKVDTMESMYKTMENKETAIFHYW